MNKFYKVLLNGVSCHGGEFKYSLPEGETPGEWHEVKGELVQCSNGFHLTDMPWAWWRQGAECYEAEFDGEALDYDKDSHKICVRKVRLLRKIDAVELGTLGVFLTGITGNVTEGMVAAIDGGTVQHMSGGTVQDMSGGTVQDMRGGTVQHMRGGTVQHMSGGTVQYMSGGTVQYMSGGTV